MSKNTAIPEEPSGVMDVDFKQIFNNSSVAGYSCNKDGKITWFNKAAVETWGRTPDLNKDCWCGSWKMFYPDGTPMPLQNSPMARILKKETPKGRSEVRIQCPDGSFKFLLVFSQPLYNCEGAIKGAFSTFVDITDQKRDHIKKETLSAIVDSSGDAIVSKDLNGKITSWNAGAERIFGYSETEAIGNPITMIIPENLLYEEEKII